MINFFGDGHLGRSTWRCCATLPEAKSFGPHENCCFERCNFYQLGAFRSIFRYELSVSFREDRDTGDANWVMFQCGTHRGFQQLRVWRRFGAFSLHIICTLETVFSFRKSGNSKIFPKPANGIQSSLMITCWVDKKTVGQKDWQ